MSQIRTLENELKTAIYIFFSPRLYVIIIHIAKILNVLIHVTQQEN